MANLANSIPALIVGVVATVDRQTEQGKFPDALGQMKTYPDRQISLRRRSAFDLRACPCCRVCNLVDRCIQIDPWWFSIQWNHHQAGNSAVSALSDPKLAVMNGGIPEAKTTIESDLPGISTARRSGPPTSR